MLRIHTCSVIWVGALLAVSGVGVAANWVDYGDVWAPDTGMISMQCVIVDADRFGESGSSPAAAPLYKMYYSNGAYPECNEIHLATSTDGLSWTFAGSVLQEGRKPVVVYSSAGLGEGAAKYRMWFTVASDEEARHRTSSFRVCQSEDGLNWGPPVACFDADSERPLLASGNSDGDRNAWNRGSYGILRILHNPDAQRTVNMDAPMSNRYAMYYNVYGLDPLSEQEGGPAVSASVATAVSADGVGWYRVGDCPVLRGVPSVLGGMVSFADMVKLGDRYVACFMAECHPAEGYVRKIGKAVSGDGVHWSVESTDIEVLRTLDQNKGTYGLALAVDPNLNELQVWLAVGHAVDALAIRFAREEE